jgi:hypothetical protein
MVQQAGEEASMMRRWSGGMDAPTVAGAVFGILLIYAAWLTSIVFCAKNGRQPLLITGAAFFPVGVVHGIGVWLGGW